MTTEEHTVFADCEIEDHIELSADDAEYRSWFLGRIAEELHLTRCIECRGKLEKARSIVLAGMD